MKKYAIWDRKTDIFTIGKDPVTGKMRFTPQEYIDKYAPWADIPGIKVVIGGGTINGTVFSEFESFVDHYKRLGAVIPDGLSDDEKLAAIEEFEVHPPVSSTPSYDERIAAGLEALVLINM